MLFNVPYFDFPVDIAVMCIMRRRQLPSAPPPQFLRSNFEHEISVCFA